VGWPSVTTTATTANSYRRLALDPLLRRGCLERIGEDTPEEERLFLDLRKDETQHDVVLENGAAPVAENLALGNLYALARRTKSTS
jgi:hypothetical protein